MKLAQLIKKRPTKRALDGWDAKRQCALAGRCSLEAHSPDLWHFQALSTPKQNPALEVLSTPAHPQVTQTVFYSPPTQTWRNYK